MVTRKKGGQGEHGKGFRDVFGDCPLPMEIHEVATGRLLEANQAFRRLFGLPPEEEPPGRIQDLLRGSSPPEAEFLDKAAKGIPRPEVVDLPEPGGGSLHLGVLSSPLVFRGRPSVQLLFMDLPGSRQARKRLAESEHLYRTLVEKNQSGVFLLKDRRLTFASPRLGRIAGRSVEELMGLPDVTALFHPEDREPALVRIGDVLGNRMGMTWPFPLRVLRPDGSVRELEIFAGRVEETGEAVVLGTVLDVTQQKSSQRKLKERLAIEEALAAVSRLLLSPGPFDMDTILSYLGKTVRASRAYILILREGERAFKLAGEWAAPGIPSVGGVVRDFPVDEIPWLWGRLGNAQRVVVPDVGALPEEASAERRRLAAMGVRSAVAFPFFSSGSLTGFLGLNDDWAPHHWSEEDLRLLQVASQMIETALQRWDSTKAREESELRYRELFMVNPNPMWVYDLETMAFLAVNEAAVRHYGYPREEFLGMTIADIRPPEDLPALREKIARVTEGLDKAGVWRHRKKDGTVIDVEITSHTMTFLGRLAELVLAHDVTGERRAKKALEGALDDLEKRNRELEAFVFTAAHDLRTPLVSLRGLTDLLERSLEGRMIGEEERILERIQVNVRHFDHLLRDLLAFAQVGRQEGERADVRVGELAEECWGELGALPPGADFLVAPGLPRPWVQPTRARQILLNLLGNSVRFHRPGVPLRVELGVLPPGKCGAPEGHRVFFVRDNGRGIPGGFHGKVFDLFFRVPGTETHGTGVGLAIVKRVVEEEKGVVRLDSRPEEETTVFFSLPVVPERFRG